jgi:hypothetical protein
MEERLSVKNVLYINTESHDHENNKNIVFIGVVGGYI